MTVDETQLKAEHFSRIRRIKRLLRFLPRKSNVHTYPIIRIFAATARKTPFLWSFKVPEVVRALYTGCILTFLPLLGVQIPLAFGAAFLFRANLPIILGLQFLSTPFTVPIIYTAAYFIGDFLLSIFGSETAMAEVGTIATEAGILQKSVHWYAALSLGGLVIGYFTGFAASLIYRVAAIRASRALARLRKLQGSRMKASGGSPSAVRKSS